MLSMTYQKFIQGSTACFIPGKIIDECYRILKLINGNEIKTLRAHEILQELRDISSMAIEHFDEKIAPDLRKVSPRDSLPCAVFEIFPRSSLDGILSLSRNSSCSSISAQSTPIRASHVRVKTKSKLSSLVKLYKKQSKVIKGQSKQIMRMVKSLNEQKSSISSLKRRLDESEAKNLELSESIKKFKEKPTGSKRKAP
jgi:F-box protein 28